MAMTNSTSSTHCLFCHTAFASLEENSQHMLLSHGFVIPYQDRLLVDLESFYAYLDSIIEDYNQCIHCFTQRASGEAVRQHMLGKGHCRIDLDRESAWTEYGDFYDFEESQDDAEADSKIPDAVPLEDGSIRLQSGKILSHRHAKARPSPGRKRLETSLVPNPPEPELPATPVQPDVDSSLAGQVSQLLLETPPSRHVIALSNMRASDRTALAHLPAAQQRALLATQRRQADSGERAQQSMHASLGAKGNKTLMKYFKPRVPKRKNGQHRESLRA